MFTYTLTPGIESDLARFEELAGRFDAVATLPRTWAGRVRRDLEAEAVGASVALEGVPVTADEVRRILAGDRPPKVSEKDSRLVEGYRDAMCMVLRRADDPNFEWSSETIRGIHERVLADSWVERAGRLRERQNWLQDSRTGERLFMPPPTHDVPVLLDGLASWLSGPAAEAAPTLVRAAIAHVRLAAIHPFADGNGRTARILASLVMYRGGYKAPQLTSLEEWWGRHPADYYAAFRCLGTEWDARADVTPFVAAHVHAQRAQAEALSLRNATERVLWTILEDLVSHDLDMDARTANALWDAFFGREVSNRYYRDLADVPQVTASHDLKQLQTAGLLAAQGAGRSRTYGATISLLRRVIDLAGLDVDARGESIDEDLRGAIISAIAAKVRC